MEDRNYWEPIEKGVRVKHDGDERKKGNVEVSKKILKAVPSRRLQRLRGSETNNESLGTISFVSQTIVDIEESVRFTTRTRYGTGVGEKRASEKAFWRGSYLEVKERRKAEEV